MITNTHETGEVSQVAGPVPVYALEGTRRRQINIKYVSILRKVTVKENVGISDT